MEETGRAKVQESMSIPNHTADGHEPGQIGTHRGQRHTKAEMAEMPRMRGRLRERTERRAKERGEWTNARLQSRE